MNPVSVVVPYSEECTPQSMFEEAKETVSKQSVQTEFITITEGDSPAEARNKGIQDAKFRFVAFLDADDLWSEDKLERQISKMKSTGAGICIEGDPLLTKEELIHGLLLGDLESLTSSILIDTKKVLTRFNEEIDRFEDHLFMIEAAMESDVCAVPDIIEVRKHEDGLSATGSRCQLYESRLAVANLLEGTEADHYVKDYRQLAYYAYGRGLQLDGQHRESTLWLIKSLQFGVAKRPLGALILSPILAARDLIKSVL